MSINEKRVEQFEKEYKQIIFNKINKICSIQAEDIILTVRNAGITEQVINNIPNIRIILNNKLSELSQIFNKAGISMYSTKAEDIDTVTSSLIGEAIIIDLIGYLSQATNKLQDYDMKSQEIIKKKAEQSKALTTVNPIKRFFTKIKALFSIVQPVDVSLTEEEIASLKNPLDEFTEINDKIGKYNLKDNIVTSIVKYIHNEGYAALTVPKLVDRRVIPDLQKLGLSDLISELQSELVEVYKKDALNLQISNENIEIYVPKFNKGNQNSLDSKELNKETGETTENILEGKGITSEELAIIDGMLNCLDAQQITELSEKEDEQEEDR